MVRLRSRQATETADGGLNGLASRLSAQCSVSEPVSHKHAAVLIPLFEDSEGVLRVLLTRRSSTLRTHKGEVCLPGGKRDEGDLNDIATALREAEEELGLDSAQVEVVGQLAPYLSKHRLSVTPVVGIIPADHHLQPNPEEVDAVFSVPLSLFSSPGSCHDYRDIVWEGSADVTFRLHFFEHGEFTIWGLTAAVLVDVARIVLGRQPDFQPFAASHQPYTDIFFDGTVVKYREA